MAGDDKTGSRNVESKIWDNGYVREQREPLTRRQKEIWLFRWSLSVAEPPEVGRVKKPSWPQDFYFRSASHEIAAHAITELMHKKPTLQEIADKPLNHFGPQTYPLLQWSDVNTQTH